MKLTIKFLFFLLFLFLLNVVFYYSSDNYKFFLQKLKYSDEVINIDNENKANTDTDTYDNITDYPDVIIIDDKNLNFENNDDLVDNTLTREVILGKNYTQILNLFKKEYNLKKIEINSTLFELTDEYPDYYYEYYSNELTVYFFPTKIYSQIFDIFNYLQESLPFSLSELNNFGEKSFYINMREDVKDNYVRIVISKNGVDFGLKIKKSEYNKVKEILLKL